MPGWLKEILVILAKWIMYQERWNILRWFLYQEDPMIFILTCEQKYSDEIDKQVSNWIRNFQGSSVLCVFQLSKHFRLSVSVQTGSVMLTFCDSVDKGDLDESVLTAHCRQPLSVVPKVLHIQPRHTAHAQNTPTLREHLQHNTSSNATLHTYKYNTSHKISNTTHPAMSHCTSTKHSLHSGDISNITQSSNVKLHLTQLISRRGRQHKTPAMSHSVCT